MYLLLLVNNASDKTCPLNSGILWLPTLSIISCFLMNPFSELRSASVNHEQNPAIGTSAPPDGAASRNRSQKTDEAPILARY